VEVHPFRSAYVVAYAAVDQMEDHFGAYLAAAYHAWVADQVVHSARGVVDSLGCLFEVGHNEALHKSLVSLEVQLVHAAYLDLTSQSASSAGGWTQIFAWVELDHGHLEETAASGDARPVDCCA
jgi:hypothetical protein